MCKLDACNYRNNSTAQKTHQILFPVREREQRTYNPTHSDFYVFILAMLLLRPYPEAKRFTVGTGHDHLKRILNLADATDMLSQWSLQLSQFGLKLVTNVWINNEAADVLSQLYLTRMGYTDIADELPVALIKHLSEDTSEYLVKEQHLEQCNCHVCHYSPPTDAQWCQNFTL